MTSAHISICVLMTPILVSCGEMTSTRIMDGNTVQGQKGPDAGSVVAPAARDVDSKGGLNQQR